MRARNVSYVPAAEAARLLEAAMNAAVELAEAPEAVLTPAGSPVQRGRVHLGRLRSRLPVSGSVVVAVGFGSACWLGSPDEPVPQLGAMAYRGEARMDQRGRVVLDRRIRAWLAVEDPACFEVLLMPAPTGGVLVVPVQDYARRLGEVRQ